MNQDRCHAFRPRLGRFADGELDAAASRDLREHLLDCLDCRAVVGETYALRKFFREEPAPAIPSGFASRVAANVFAREPLSREDRTALPFAKALAAVAAAAAIFLGGVLIAQTGAAKRSGFEAQAASPGKVGDAIEKFRESRRSPSAR